MAIGDFDKKFLELKEKKKELDEAIKLRNHPAFRISYVITVVVREAITFIAFYHLFKWFRWI